MEVNKGIDEALASGAKINRLADEELETYMRRLREARASDFKSRDQLGFLAKQKEPGQIADIGFLGLVGDFAKMVTQDSETDERAVLVQTLIALGNYVGRNPFFRVDSTNHYANEFAVIIGKSSRARKGTAFGHVVRLLECLDLEYAKKCLVTGLSTGQGLVHRLRDGEESNLEEGDGVRKKKDKPVDVGIRDKRLLVVEPEMASVLKASQRDGNNLSAIIRTGFDSPRAIHVITRKDPITATEAHISIIGHTTGDEFRRDLSDIDITNGFLNRFLMCHVARQAEKPFGANLDLQKFDLMANEISRVLNEAKKFGEITRDAESNDMWEALYSALTHDEPGLIGSILARREVHVMRLSMVIAVLCGSTTIKTEHLMSALAIWKYSEESARYYFSDKTGNAIADKIVLHLREASEGLSRNAIKELFKNNKSKDEIESALRFLHSLGLVDYRMDRPGMGRPSEIWFLTEKVKSQGH